jgi:hypothetical protein
VSPSELVTEGFTAVPFSIGDERSGVLVCHTIVAPGQDFGRIQGIALLADIVGHALTVARTREATNRLCDKLSLELGMSRRKLTESDQTLRAREDSIGRLTRELIRSNNVKTEFLATVSHELRTPLNAILGYSELLYDGHIGAMTTDQVESIGRVLRAARNLTCASTTCSSSSRWTRTRWSCGPSRPRSSGSSTTSSRRSRIVRRRNRRPAGWRSIRRRR